MQSGRKNKANLLKTQEKIGPTLEQIAKFQENVKKKRLNIEKKYSQSTMNKLYIFPRGQVLSTSNSSASLEDLEIQPIYNLKSQNLVSRKNQTKTVRFEQQKSCQYASAKSAKSFYSVEQGGRTLKDKKSKSKNIEISFNTRKKSPSKKKTNSQAKLFIEQYSLDNRINVSTKKPSKGLLISFRGHKNQQINVSFSKKRVKTQLP